MASSVDTRQVMLSEELLYHKSQTLLESLFNCNLVFKIDDNISEREISNALMERSGTNAISNHIGVVNFTTINNVLQALNQFQLDEMEMGPLESLIFKLITSSRLNCVDERSGLFVKGPISYMTKLINPLGLIMTNAEHIVKVVPRSLSVRLLINGNVNEILEGSLRIPSHMTVNKELLFQPKRQDHILYLIMAPYPECLENAYSNVSFSTSQYGSMDTENNLILQSYAISFAVHNVTTTPIGAASQTMMRCKAFTNFHDIFKMKNAHREIAVTPLGLIPSSSYVPNIYDNFRDKTQTLILDNFIFTPKEWQYYVMEYNNSSIQMNEDGES